MTDSILATLLVAAQGGRRILEDSGISPITVAAIVVAVLVALILFVILFRYLNLYVQSLLTGAGVGLFEMVAMSLRKVNVNTIVRSKITAVQAGLTEVTTRDLEAHYLAGGNVVRVVQALIKAHRADIKLNLKMGTGIDLAGRDVDDAVRTSVTPKVIDCPDPRKGEFISAVAKDGIELKVKARVTVRMNIARLIGGATEETIIARVGEGIVASIGSRESYKDVLENPDHISKTVLAKGLDAGTAFEIVSIDMADVDVGQNVGARLQADQAEADMRRAKAKAEERRAMAVAQEQEQRAEVTRNRSLVTLAEAEIPKAMAEALRSGNLGVMDLYRLRNVDADTQMRDSISKGGSQQHPTDTGEAPRPSR
ncbi:MAG TPA: flotillin-like protein FloA [Planctomycetota bacterium]|nr:flotillin-like protein FloA [Planctomycetota bacterium]